MIEYPLTKMNASAGSGKTYALTNQFVDLLFASDLAPCESCKPVKNKKKYNFSELLAITFTNLAANQMKEKVIQILKQYAFKEIPCASEEEKEEKSKQAHAMLENIFQQYGALNIRTIDSLLNQILGLFALELGYSPHFKASFGSRDCIDELYTRLAEESLANEESMESGAINYAPVFHELCK
ncbi:MAG: UvrD-helicase domain-containing protein, partial [Mailhella sp.]|nr:UvrD-helicase domain-containing protein [Mailhella sp.]